MHETESSEDIYFDKNFEQNKVHKNSLGKHHFQDLGEKKALGGRIA